MNKIYAVTIDIGTTNSKVSLFKRETGELVKRDKFDTPKLIDDHGELFDHELIYQKILTVLSDYYMAFPGMIDSVNLSSVGEAGVLIDKDYQIVTPMIAWYDKRARDYTDALSAGEKERIYTITGLPAHSNYSIPKIKWMLDHLELPEETYTWLNVPDLLAFRLTGAIKTEFSMASRTLALDLNRRTWSEEVLRVFGLANRIEFPEILASGDIVGHIQPAILPQVQAEEISVRIAGHDHMVGALSIGLSEEKMLNSTGTTEGLLEISETLSSVEKNYPHALSMGIFTDPHYYTLFSSMPTAGNAFEWYMKLFDLTEAELAHDCEELYHEYREDQRGPDDGLWLIPHLNGSGAPYKTGTSQGLIYGLKQSTRRIDILFGIITGLCLEMKLTATCFDMERITELLAIGPVIKNPLWLQMKADAIGLPIEAVEVEEAVSFGALTAAYPELSYQYPCGRVDPLPQKVQHFETAFETYQELYRIKKTTIEDSPDASNGDRPASNDRD